MTIDKYFALFLLLIGFICSHAYDNEESEIDKETLPSHHQLIEAMFNESVKLTGYAFDRAGELCQKLLDEEIYKNGPSEAFTDHETFQNNCVHRVVSRLDPTAYRRGNHPDDILLRKYGFDNALKVMDQKYAEFYVEIVRRIDAYVRGLTREQRRKKSARNLRRWSRKIKKAPTLAKKEMAFGKCMRFYYFEGGV
ncbi:uncharacterized protein LOC105219076 [Zeugodacus cucurbitae]|uniref:uncharacterized protein LOC105219076 n=1 Tax=Zeugodacus cucurbitae TaxID=28588 RepID=UPI0023D945F1|nr:uncharacterized protein LOC105219076 [Zeugodacus cucurbitae]